MFGTESNAGIDLDIKTVLHPLRVVEHGTYQGITI